MNEDVIKWKHFPCYWPFVKGIHRWPVDSPNKDQVRGALMLSLICAWTNDWAKDRYASDLRRHRTHYDVTVMSHQEAGLASHDTASKHCYLAIFPVPAQSLHQCHVNSQFVRNKYVIVMWRVLIYAFCKMLYPNQWNLCDKNHPSKNNCSIKIKQWYAPETAFYKLDV